MRTLLKLAALLMLTAPLGAQEGAVSVRVAYPACEDRAAAVEMMRAYGAEGSADYYRIAKRRMLAGSCLTLSRGRAVEIVSRADSLGVLRVRLLERGKGEPEIVWVGSDAVDEPS